ncbi:MAG TPA: hypothetical protein VM536_09905, partial [Chloroflexia bacterium]|nr:hypothetical protein [Chloroflexia bacterium]
MMAAARVWMACALAALLGVGLLGWLAPPGLLLAHQALPKRAAGVAGPLATPPDVANYTFASAAGVALEDLTTGGTQLIGAGADDTASAVTNIGFDFYYTGARYTQFSVNANGLMHLGSNAVTTSFNNTTDYTTATDNPGKIAPYYDDLHTGVGGKVQYKLIGAAPSRKLAVEWFVTVPRAPAGNANARFQVWLFESTGMVSYVYGSGIGANAGGYTVGVANAATNWASVTTSTATVSYSVHNSTQTTALTTGTRYSFTPPVPAPPTDLTFSLVGSGS